MWLAETMWTLNTEDVGVWSTLGFGSYNDDLRTLVSITRVEVPFAFIRRIGEYESSQSLPRERQK